MGGFEPKGCYFQLHQVSIIYPLKEDSSPEICLLHEKVKWWMGWSKTFAKSKAQLLSWVEKGQKANWNQAQGQGQHCACFESSKLVRGTWQNSQNVNLDFWLGSKDVRECKYRVGDTSFVSEKKRTFVAHTSTLHTKWGTMFYLLFPI